MTIRRRIIEGASRRVRPSSEPCLNAQNALQHGREAVSRAFESAAGEISDEISRARAVFADAEHLMASDARKVRSLLDASEAAYQKTVSAAEQGENSAKSALKKMLENLNKITESLSNEQPPPPGSSHR
jgi:hypothetical protein